MQRGHWRFRVQTLLVLVALAGIVMGGGMTAMRLTRRSHAYRQAGRMHAMDEASHRATAAGLRAQGDIDQGTKQDGYAVSHVKWVRVYEHAADNPWVIVTPPSGRSLHD